MSVLPATKRTFRGRVKEGPIYRKFRGGVDAIRIYGNWPEIIINKVLRREKNIEEVVLRNGTRYRVRTGSNDKDAIREVYLLNSYQIEEGDIADDATVIDIGAHIGVFSVFAAKRGGNVAVYAFDPDPANYALLLDNVEMNKSIGKVHTFRMAVSGRKGKRRLVRSRASLARHSLFDNRYLNQGETQDIIEVECTTLYDIFAENSIERCDVLKLDCEGAEYEILLNTDDSVLSRIRKITLEYHDGVVDQNHEDLLEFLRARNFRVYAKTGPTTPDIQLGTLCALNTSF